MCSFHFSSLLCVLCSVPWSVYVNSYGPLWTELWGHIMDFWGEQKALYMEKLWLFLPCECGRDMLHNWAWDLCAKAVSATERSVIIWWQDLKKKDEIFGKFWVGWGCWLRCAKLATKLPQSVALAQNFILSTCFIKSVSNSPTCLPCHLLSARDFGRNRNQPVRDVRCSSYQHIYAGQRLRVTPPSLQSANYLY